MARTKTAKPRATTTNASDKQRQAEEESFTRSLVRHGQAARRGADGRLPPGATHELVDDGEGPARVVRRRFSSI
jgi:hypothetical protein